MQTFPNQREKCFDEFILLVLTQSSLQSKKRISQAESVTY